MALDGAVDALELELMALDEDGAVDALDVEAEDDEDELDAAPEFFLLLLQPAMARPAMAATAVSRTAVLYMHDPLSPGAEPRCPARRSRMLCATT